MRQAAMVCMSLYIRCPPVRRAGRNYGCSFLVISTSPIRPQDRHHYWSKTNITNGQKQRTDYLDFNTVAGPQAHRWRGNQYELGCTGSTTHVTSAYGQNRCVAMFDRWRSRPLGAAAWFGAKRLLVAFAL